MQPENLEAEISESFRRWKYALEQGNTLAAKKWSDRWVQLSAQRRGQQPVKMVEVRSAADEQADQAQIDRIVRAAVSKARRYEGIHIS